MEFKSALFRVKETKEELEQLHKISEEEVKRRGGMRRGESVESNVDMLDSPRGRSGIRNAGSSARSEPCTGRLCRWETECRPPTSRRYGRARRVSAAMRASPAMPPSRSPYLSGPGVPGGAPSRVTPAILITP